MAKMQQNKQYFFAFGEPQVNEQQLNYFGHGHLAIYCSTLKYKSAHIATNGKLNSSRINMDDLHASIYFSLLILLAGDIQLNTSYILYSLRPTHLGYFVQSER